MARSDWSESEELTLIHYDSLGYQHKDLPGVLLHTHGTSRTVVAIRSKLNRLKMDPMLYDPLQRAWIKEEVQRRITAISTRNAIKYVCLQVICYGYKNNVMLSGY